MNFLSNLPQTLGKFDSIGLIMDRLTKLSHSLSVKTNYNIERLAKRSIQKIICFHGAPISSILSRGTQYTLYFWSFIQ